MAWSQTRPRWWRWGDTYGLAIPREARKRESGLFDA